MEKKEIFSPTLSSLPFAGESQNLNFSQLAAGFTRFLADTRAMKRLARLYAYFLDEEVRPLQAVYFTYAQLFALLVLMPFDCGAGWRACFLVLFCLSVDKALQKPEKSKPS